MNDDRPYLFDVSRLIWRRWAGRLPTGIDRVCLAYLRHYRGQSRAVVQRRGFRRILGASASERLFDHLLETGRSFRADLVKTLARGALRSSPAAPGSLYLNVGHTGLDDPGFRRWVGRQGVRPIYMVHDLIPITHPEYCRAGEAERHRLRIRNMLETAAGIVGNSKATLHALEDFRNAELLQAVPMMPALLGIDVPAAAARTPSDRPTFVVLGTIEARKNHLLLLQVWMRLVERLGSNAPRLLVIGQRGWECEQVFDLLDHCDTLKSAVVEIGGCSDRELAAHLASARALLFPSLVEGFGLPLAEALSAGTPVIASDLPVFREIGQGIPDFLDPLDGQAWEGAILAYADGIGPARQAQLQRLQGYRPPTWDDHFRKVDDWLTRL